MEFLDITPLGTTYRYAVKIEQKFKQKRREFAYENSSQSKQGKATPTHMARDREKMDTLRTTIPRCNTRREMKRRKEYRKIPSHNTEECPSK
jgi:hypothetical protein